ncbi:MAG: hypothetical protein Q7J34_11460 [Bacteroidales bacterium]|jgi:glutathione synthase/RimK-type ligase-like ATP-grasp enzyme|nr:hypothetical protein [Bacteroidales bacterium]
MNLKFAAVTRGQKYSPNHIGNDSQIMRLTIAELEKMGHRVRIYEEDIISPEVVTENFIFTMIRGSYALEKLVQFEKNGAFVINSTEAVLNCYRDRMARILPEAGVPFPKSIIVETSAKNIDFSGFENQEKLWVKRGDVHAIHREDVTLVYQKEELYSVLLEYERRGIEKAVIQEQLDGDVVKFYAVNDSKFFHWYYHNGSRQLPFDPKFLHKIALDSARALKVDIYGGDAVVGEDGSVKIIDLNDWPSFAPVREIASKHIAELIHNKALDFHSKIL